LTSKALKAFPFPGRPSQFSASSKLPGGYVGQPIISPRTPRIRLRSATRPSPESTRTFKPTWLTAT